MKNLLYIHGYNGSPEGNSCSLIRKFMPSEEWNVMGMDYCQDDCRIALEQIKNTISERKIDLVVGSSLGGYLALLTTGIERIAINPCYHPSIELPKLGPLNGVPSPAPEMISSYEAYEHCLKEFSEGEKALITGYFSIEDELLGDRYQEEFNEDIGEIHLVSGGHHLSENAAKEICKRLLLGSNYLLSAHKASFKNKDSLQKSIICGCYSCGMVFKASEVSFIRESDDKETGLCPYCNVDSVIGDEAGFPIDDKFLQEMNEKWF